VPAVVPAAIRTQRQGTKAKKCSTRRPLRRSSRPNTPPRRGQEANRLSGRRWAPAPLTLFAGTPTGARGQRQPQQGRPSATRPTMGHSDPGYRSTSEHDGSSSESSPRWRSARVPGSQWRARPSPRPKAMQRLDLETEPSPSQGNGLSVPPDGGSLRPVPTVVPKPFKQEAPIDREPQRPCR
jgi:hypothetical protein